MVDQDCLAALDALLWLRTGDEVVRRFGFSEAAVSRRSRRCLELFDLELQRIDGEWCTVGQHPLLPLEREIHQLARWQGLRPLRLEATYWSGPLLCTPPPPGWMLGLSNIVGMTRNLQLLRERIVDAFVAGLPDRPPAGDPDLSVIVLSDMPVFFVVRPDHPLADRTSLSLADIAQYPTLALPEGAYPLVEQALRAIGLWNDPVRMGRYRRERWEGKAEADLCIGYGTPLSMAISGGHLVRLPLELPFRSGDALVVRRTFANHPRLQALRDHLLARLRDLAVQHPDLRVIEPD